MDCFFFSDCLLAEMNADFSNDDPERYSDIFRRDPSGRSQDRAIPGYLTNRRSFPPANSRYKKANPIASRRLVSMIRSKTLKLKPALAIGVGSRPRFL